MFFIIKSQVGILGVRLVPFNNFVIKNSSDEIPSVEKSPTLYVTPPTLNS